MGIVLENATPKKPSLRIWAHSVGEYLYILRRSGLTVRHKTYSISQQDEDFFGMNRKQSVKRGVWYVRDRRRRTRRQKGRFLPIAGLLGSVAAQLIGEIAKPILRKIFAGRRIRRRRHHRYA